MKTHSKSTATNCGLGLSLYSSFDYTNILMFLSSLMSAGEGNLGSFSSEKSDQTMLESTFQSLAFEKACLLR